MGRTLMAEGLGAGGAGAGWVERLGVEHPHHVLWQLLALAHGHLDRSGRPSSRPGKGLHQRVDLAKVEAAKALLARVGAHPHR